MDIRIKEFLYAKNFSPLWEMIFVDMAWFAIKTKKNLTFNIIDNIRYIFLDFGVHFYIDKSMLYKNFEVLSAIFQKDVINEKNYIFQFGNYAVCKSS